MEESDNIIDNIMNSEMDMSKLIDGVINSDMDVRKTFANNEMDGGDNSAKTDNNFNQKPNDRDKNISVQQENEKNIDKKKTNVVNLSSHQLNDDTL